LQLLKTNFDSVVIDSLERVGLNIGPALLNTNLQFACYILHTA